MKCEGCFWCPMCVDLGGADCDDRTPIHDEDFVQMAVDEYMTILIEDER